MDSKFNIGDVVYLKSKGPAMTVAKVIDDVAECIWFGLDVSTDDLVNLPIPAADLPYCRWNGPHQATFPMACLVKA